MPSSNKTSLGLNQWDGNDKPKREDFNRDNSIINAEIENKISSNRGIAYNAISISEPEVGTVNLSLSNGTFQIALYSSGVGQVNLFSMNPSGTSYLSSSLSPTGANIYDLGAAYNAWKDGYFLNDITITSDSEKKTDIQDLSPELCRELINLLRPVSYKLKDGTSGRRHFGLIAQDVEKSLEQLGINSNDFAGIIKHPINDESGNFTGKYEYGLRMSEFIPIIIRAMQV